MAITEDGAESLSSAPSSPQLPTLQRGSPHHWLVMLPLRAPTSSGPQFHACALHHVVAVASLLVPTPRRKPVSWRIRTEWAGFGWLLWRLLCLLPSLLWASQCRCRADLVVVGFSTPVSFTLVAVGSPSLALFYPDRRGLHFTGVVLPSSLWASLCWCCSALVVKGFHSPAQFCPRRYGVPCAGGVMPICHVDSQVFLIHCHC
jgi:hypothetical protein